MSSDFVTVTRTLVKRGWSDIEPKIAFGLVSGGIASVALNIATAYGIHIPVDVQNEIPYALAVLGGYLTPSVGTTITQPTNSKVLTETHSGNTVTTVTAPTAIQPAAPAPRKYDDILNNLGKTPTTADNQATTVFASSDMGPDH